MPTYTAGHGADTFLPHTETFARVMHVLLYILWNSKCFWSGGLREWNGFVNYAVNNNLANDWSMNTRILVKIR